MRSKPDIGDYYWAIRHSARFGTLGAIAGGFLGLGEGCGGMLIGAILGYLVTSIAAFIFQWNLLTAPKNREDTRDALKSTRLRAYGRKTVPMNMPGPGAAHPAMSTLAPPRTTTEDGPTYLQVSYSEKDQAKHHGARWDPLRKSWYVPTGRSLEEFRRWLPPEPPAPSGPMPQDGPAWLRLARYFDRPIQLLLLENTCWKCRRKGYAVALAVHLLPGECHWIPNEMMEEAGIASDGQHSWIWVEGSAVCEPFVMEQLTAYLATRPGERGCVASFRRRYSKTLARTYLSQGCPRCQALWGDHPLGELSVIYLEQVASQHYEGGLHHAFDLVLNYLPPSTSGIKKAP